MSENPSPRAQHQAEALGRQVMNTLLSLLYEGIETKNQALVTAAYAPIRWEEHANQMFRQMLLQHLKVKLFTFTSPNPLLAGRLVPFQWVEIKPEDYAYISGKVQEMRMDLGEQMSEMLADITPRPESREDRQSE